MAGTGSAGGRTINADAVLVAEGLGDALAVGEDVVSPCTGLDVFLCNYVAAQVNILGCAGRSVLTQAITISSVRISCCPAIYLDDLVFGVVGVLMEMSFSRSPAGS